MSLASARFADVYDTLPTDVQSVIVEKQLIPLLDLVSKAKRKKVLSSASKMQRRHAGIPTLDLKAKRREVNSLLDELHRDAKRYFVKERSHRTELLEQTVESVTCWLNDIWRVVYEHNVDFLLAHRCLMFVVNTLDQIGHGRTSCHCAFTSMYVPVTLKRRSGKVVKSWQINGAHNVEEVVQFIWRDLFLSMLATGTQRQIRKIPEMLDDIEDIMGWTALERLLYGGRKCPHDIELDPDEDVTERESDIDEDEDAYTTEDSDLDNTVNNSDWVSKVPRVATPSHPKHWSHRISSQMWQFRRHVHTAMMAVFKVNPSLRLYSALLSNSTDPETTESELMRYLSQMATTCPEVFAAALDIHALENNTSTLASLLSTHGHLLRPRDAPIFQSAVTALAGDPFHHARALELIEQELLDTSACIRAALLASFSLIETTENKAELEYILKLRNSAPGRQDRVERWVDAVTTPGTNNPNPMALAAMVIGLPIIPPLDGTEDADPLGYLDLDPSDPDTEDLREEFRPRLKQRFEGWSDTAITVKSGANILLKVYKELTKTMPFLRASDIVEEILSRLSEKPSKQYLIDAVDALSAFVKVQRRKVTALKKEQKDLSHAATQTSTPATPVAGPSKHPASPPAPAPGPGTSTSSTAAPTAPAIATGGSQSSTPEQPQPETPPPPLELATPVPASLFTFYTGHIPAPPGAGLGGGGDMFGFGGMEDVD